MTTIPSEQEFDPSVRHILAARTLLILQFGEARRDLALGPSITR
jgi:hypothetical protein